MAKDVELRAKVEAIPGSLEGVSRRLETVESELTTRIATLEMQEAKAAQVTHTLACTVDEAYADLESRTENRLSSFERNAACQELFSPLELATQSFQEHLSDLRGRIDSIEASGSKGTTQAPNETLNYVLQALQNEVADVAEGAARSPGGIARPILAPNFGITASEPFASFGRKSVPLSL